MSLLRLPIRLTSVLRRSFSGSFKTCSKCEKDLSHELFYKKSRNHTATYASCKACIARLKDNDRSSRFSSLINTARHKQKQWNSLNSRKACTFDVDLQLLNDLLTSQRGKCYYSKIPLSLRSYSDWQCSLERLNPGLGYSRDNVALIALEFNTAVQWTLTKIAEVPHFIHRAPTISNAEFINARYKQKRKLRKARSKRFETLTDYYCWKCSTWKRHHEFYKHNTCSCRSCEDARVRSYKTDSLRGFAICLYHSAKFAASKKMTFGCETRNQCTLKVDHIFDMMEAQQFRCYYSGIPMSFRRNSDWRCSIERLDNMHGYTPDNAVLICREFNSADHTTRAGVHSDVSGSGQWNKTKFRHFLDVVQNLPAVASSSHT